MDWSPNVSTLQTEMLPGGNQPPKGYILTFLHLTTS